MRPKIDGPAFGSLGVLSAYASCIGGCSGKLSRGTAVSLQNVLLCVAAVNSKLQSSMKDMVTTHQTQQ